MNCWRFDEISFSFSSSCSTPSISFHAQRVHVILWSNKHWYSTLAKQIKRNWFFICQPAPSGQNQYSTMFHFQFDDGVKVSVNLWHEDYEEIDNETVWIDKIVSMSEELSIGEKYQIECLIRRLVPKANDDEHVSSDKNIIVRCWQMWWKQLTWIQMMAAIILASFTCQPAEAILAHVPREDMKIYSRIIRKLSRLMILTRCMTSPKTLIHFTHSLCYRLKFVLLKARRDREIHLEHE